MKRFYTSNELLELKNKGTVIEIKNDYEQKTLEQHNYFIVQKYSELGFVNNTNIISLKVEKLDNEIIKKMIEYIKKNNADKNQVYTEFNGIYNKENIYNLIMEENLI